MIRPPTLRTVGILGAIAGAIALAVPFAWRSFWPTPYATIELPDSSASAGDCFLARGDVAPSTIWQPLWLIEASDRSGWRPLERIDPAHGTWQHKICVSGSTHGVYGLALVVVDRDRDEEYRRPPVETEEDIPEWLKRRPPEEQGGRGRRHREGLDPIPPGATLVASVSLAVIEGDEPNYPMGPGPGYIEDAESRRASLRLFEQMQREQNLRHDQRRVLRSQGAAQVTAHAAAASDTDR